MRCADHCESAEAFIRGEFFCCSHIYEFEMTIVLNHYIFWFQIAIDYVFKVQILNAEHYGGYIETTDNFRHNTNIPDDIKQIEAFDIFHE
jgi:hypothetical protein